MDTPLTPVQQEIARRLRATSDAAGSRRVLYGSEWLGYLPFGLYHWVTVGGEDVANRWPWDWAKHDLDALVRADVLTLVSERVNPQDSSEIRAEYVLTEVRPDGTPISN